MKFGGTSVADPEGRAALRARVRRARDAGRAAGGRRLGDGPRGQPVRHRHAARPRRRAATTTPRARPARVACGEVISAVVVAHELRCDGVAAAAVHRRGGRHPHRRRRRATPRSSRSTPARCSRRSTHGVVPGRRRLPGRRPRTARLTTLGRGGSRHDRVRARRGARGRGGRDLHRRRRRHDRRPARRATAPRCSTRRRTTSSSRWRTTAPRSCTRPPPSSRWRAAWPLRVRNTFSDDAGHARRRRHRRRTAPTRVATAVSHVDGVARFAVPLPDGAEGGSHMRAQTRVYRAHGRRRASASTCSRPCGDALVFTVLERGLACPTRCVARPLEPALRRRDAGPRRRSRSWARACTACRASWRASPRRSRDAGVDVLQTADSPHDDLGARAAEQAADATRCAALHDGVRARRESVATRSALDGCRRWRG